MAEGDVWANATDSTLHFEKGVKTIDTSLGIKIFNIVYWCGFMREPKHHKVGSNAGTLTYASIDLRTCKRCVRNRSKSESSPSATEGKE